MPDEKEKGGFDDMIRGLEDDLFSVQKDEEPKESAAGVVTPARRQTLPTLVNQETAKGVLKDFMKEKNQRKYDIMGVELLYKPYWFFTYSAELVMHDNNKNITDAEELSGRVAIDAINASLADYLQDLLDHEPIELVDLADELAQAGGEAKIIEPKISEDRVEKMVQQKIAGVLKSEKDNVAVAGFELVWSPVYRFWLTIKKKTHNVQIDGCGGYPVNYDDVPAKPKTWTDVVMGDIEKLKNPKKWKELLQSKGKAMRGMASGKQAKKPSAGTIELVVGFVIAIIFIYGLLNKNLQYMSISAVLAVLLFWYMNYKRKSPLIPLPPPPFMGPQEGG